MLCDETQQRYSNRRCIYSQDLTLKTELREKYFLKSVFLIDITCARLILSTEIEEPEKTFLNNISAAMAVNIPPL